jgi:type II secretory pathway pseudopilin PulG
MRRKTSLANPTPLGGAPSLLRSLRQGGAFPPMRRKNERGYILLTLIFFVAVLAISLATILPSIKQEILRDREEEMIHRGTQYTRAIRLYYKKNGRYPAKIEDLENTNNIRYLRRRYKDPTVKGEDSPEADFKILRFGDPSVRLSQGGQIPGAQTAQTLAAASANGALSSQGVARGPNSPAAAAAKSDPTDPSQNPDAAAQDANGNPANGDSTSADASSSKPNDQAFGGGAMVGVTSTNANLKDPAIREFNKKHHYNEWQFIYDPQTDRGGLPTGPWQPAQFPGQSGAQQKPVGTPADQMSNPVAAPSGNTTIPEPIQNPAQ